MTNYFKGVRTLKTAKKRWKDLCKKYHPDAQGNLASEELMKEINAAYYALLVRLQKPRPPKPKMHKPFQREEPVDQEDTQDDSEREWPSLSDMLSDDELEEVTNSFAHAAGSFVSMGIKAAARRIRSRK